jgi:hypothetical protein
VLRPSAGCTVEKSAYSMEIFCLKGGVGVGGVGEGEVVRVVIRNGS